MPLIAIPSGADEAQTASSIGFLPRGLTSFGAASDGGWLYVLGGYFGTPHEYSVEGQSRAFMRINLLDPSDVRLLEDVEPIQSVELVAWNGKLIRVGGLHARNSSGAPSDLESSAEVASFDPISGEWTTLPSLPEPRSSHRAVVIGDTLHVVAGWTLRGADTKPHWATTHLTLELSEPGAQWASFDAPFRARAVGAAPRGADLCVIGGITPERSVSSGTWLLDTTSGTWSEGPEFPDWGFGLSATACEHGVAACGKSGVVYTLVDGGDEWATLGQLGHGRIFHELVTHEDSLIALGGIVGMGVRGRVRNIERLTAGDTGRSMERFVVPAPGVARNRFGMFVEGGSVYLFGGNTSLGQHDFEPENFTNQAWRLDLGSLEWTRLEPLPTPRQTIQAAVNTEGAVGFAVGGFGHNGVDAVTQSSSWLYDFEFGEWTEGPALLGSRSQFGLARHEGELWAFGGLDYDPSRPKGEQFDHRVDVLRWNGKDAGFADSGVRLLTPRRAFAGAKLEGSYYMVGGMREGFSLVEDAVAFDFGEGEWRDLPAPRRPRLGADLVPIDGRLYLVGGSSPREGGKGLESNGSVECFRPETQEWSTVIEDLEMEMKHARAFQVDGRLCVLTLHRDGATRAEVVYVDVSRNGQAVAK